MSPDRGAAGRAPGVDVEADLTLEVDDGAGGHAVARLHGRGTDLRLDVDGPEVLDAVRPRGGLPVPWELLGDGVRLEVHGPGGRIATVDPARPRRLAGLVTGDRHVRPGPAAPGVGARSLWRRRPGLVGLGAGVLAAAAVVAVVGTVGRAGQSRA